MLLQNPYYLYLPAPVSTPTFSIIQKIGQFGGAASASLASNVTAGNSVIGCFLVHNSSTTTVTATATIAGSPVALQSAIVYSNTAEANAVGYFYLTNAPTGAFSVTISVTNYYNAIGIQLYEVTPLASSTPVVNTNYVNIITGATEPVITDASTPTSSVPSFVITSMMDNGSYTNLVVTLPSQWTFDSQSFNGATNYMSGAVASSILPANTAVNAVWSETNISSSKPQLFTTVAFAI